MHIAFLEQSVITIERNSIYTPFIYLYTPLKILIKENTNLPLNLFFLFISSSSSSLCAPQFPYSFEVTSFEKIVRMTLKNSENEVEINFKTVEKEGEEVDNIQVRFFFFFA